MHWDFLHGIRQSTIVLHEVLMLVPKSFLHLNSPTTSLGIQPLIYFMLVESSKSLLHHILHRLAKVLEVVQGNLVHELSFPGMA